MHIEASIAIDAQLFTVDGRLVSDGKDVSSVDLSGLPDAVYIVIIKDNTTGATLKTIRVVKNSN